MSSSANSVDTGSSISRRDNKLPYTPDSLSPVLGQNERQRVSLDSPSPTDDRVQLSLIHSLRDLHLTDSRRALHLTRPSSNPETDHHPTPKSEEHLDSWAFPQYTQSSSLTDGSKHPAPLNHISSLPTPTPAMAERPKGKRGKLPKPVTNYLKDWLHRHSDHPYPTEDEKKQLSQATGLSMSQVSNWMINVWHFPPPAVPGGRFTFLLRPAVGFSHRSNVTRPMRLVHLVNSERRQHQIHSYQIPL